MSGPAPAPSPYLEWQTPAGAALELFWQAETSEAAQAALDTALAAMGTRHDYHRILGEARERAQLPRAGIELVCHLDIVLVLGDPVAAVTAPHGGALRHDAACASFLRLLYLYKAEGFLVEAATVERQLDQLPRELQPRYDWGERATALMAALEELKG
ncbi:MAG: hypothetical protein MSC31_18700 [Solirubrobacteraceae bacterium MAG38_C4-C5]|nr:hypothetical protein [Candidatus Siliceabacter maunaloa]